MNNHTFHISHPCLLELYQALVGVGENHLGRHAHEQPVTDDSHDVFQVAGELVGVFDNAELGVCNQVAYAP